MTNSAIIAIAAALAIAISTINKICYYLQCDVGDILKFDGNFDEENVDE